MTKKHFEAIARILSQYTLPDAAPGFDEGYASASHGIVNDLADYFAAENPRFDRARFVKACGL